MKKTALLLILLLPWLFWQTVPGTSALAYGNSTAPLHAGITPTPQPAGETAGGSPRPGGSPIMGILILLAPAVWMVWKSAHTRELKKVRSSCCLPVMEDGPLPKPTKKNG